MTTIRGLILFKHCYNLSSQLCSYLCFRTLKTLGQWESLESLAAASSAPGALGGVSANSNASLGGSCNASGGSPFWGIRVEVAWRHNEWSDVFYGLSGVSICSIFIVFPFAGLLIMPMFKLGRTPLTHLT